MIPDVSSGIVKGALKGCVKGAVKGAIKGAIMGVNEINNLPNQFFVHLKKCSLLANRAILDRQCSVELAESLRNISFFLEPFLQS